MSATTKEWFVKGPVYCPEAVFWAIDHLRNGRVKRLRPSFQDEVTGASVPVMITGLEMIGGAEGEFRVAFTGSLHGDPVTGNFEPEAGRGYMCLA